MKYVPTNCKGSNALRSQKAFQEINPENPESALIVKYGAFICFFIYLLCRLFLFLFYFLDFVENKNSDRNGMGVGLTIASPP